MYISEILWIIMFLQLKRISFRRNHYDSRSCDLVSSCDNSDNVRDVSHKNLWNPLKFTGVPESGQHTVLKSHPALKYVNEKTHEDGKIKEKEEVSPPLLKKKKIWVIVVWPWLFLSERGSMTTYSVKYITKGGWASLYVCTSVTAKIMRGKKIYRKCLDLWVKELRRQPYCKCWWCKALNVKH